MLAQRMKKSASLFLFLAVLIGSAPNVSPCSCRDQSEREKFRTADYVFVGQALEIADSNLEYFIYAVKFRVEKQWKGSRTSEQIVNFDFDTPGMCGDLNLEKGKRYLVYAYRKKEGLVSYTDCGPNLKIEHAADSMKKLDNPMYRVWSRLYPL